MRRPSAARLGIALGLVACAWFVPERGQAQHAVRRPPQPKVIVYKPQGETQALVGVMGQVLRPGTYRFAHAPTLQLAVDSAGGLSERASPMVRVVRGQRVVQRVALHAAAQDTLQAGDLIIVDAQPQRKDVTEPAADAGVQLAFLGVADRPVIVKVHSSQARADLIVQMLGQSPDLLRDLRMIPPPNQNFEPQENGAPRSAPLLREGSVLLFDPQRIAAGEVRDLPEIIPCSLPEPDIGAYGVRNAYEERQAMDVPPRRPTAESGVLSQVPPPPLETSTGDSPTLLPDDRIPATLSSTGRIGNAAAPVTTLPFTAGTAISARASRSTESASAPSAETAADARDPAWNRLADSQPHKAIDPSPDGSDADIDGKSRSSAGSLSIGRMLTIIASAGLLVGLALAIRKFSGSPAAPKQDDRNLASSPLPHERRRSEPPRASIPVPHVALQAFSPIVSAATSADRTTAGERFELRQQRFTQLVNRELSQIEEPLALPPGLLWSTTETGEAIRRTPAIPESRPSTENPSIAAAAIRQIDPPHPQRVPGPHHRAAHEAPVERALRQLQGGLP